MPYPLHNLLWTLFSQVSSSCHQVRLLATHVRNDSISHQSKVIDTLETAIRVESQLAAWKRSLPEQDRSDTHVIHLPDTVGQQSFPSKALVFMDVQDGARWLGFWGSHNYILRALLDVLDLLDGIDIDRSCLSVGIPSRETLRSQVLSNVEDICSSVPFMLGEIDTDGNPSCETRGRALGAYFMAQSLDKVNEVADIQAAQRKYTLDCLLKIGCGWGIGAALRSRTKWLQVFGSCSGQTPMEPAIPILSI